MRGRNGSHWGVSQPQWTFMAAWLGEVPEPWSGRVVGCWVQDPDASVRVILREDVGADAVGAFDREAARLTGWLDGEIVNSVYASRQMREARLP